MKNNRIILKSQRRFRSEKHSVLLKKLKRIQSIDSLEKYAYGTTEEMIHRKEEIKCSNIIKQCNN